MKLRELNATLQKKLSFTRRDCKAHIDYRYETRDGYVALPTLVRVSHGDGEVDFTNVKGVAKAIGLRVGELETTVACRIGWFALHLALCERLMSAAVAYSSCGVHRVTGPQAMAESVSIILTELRSKTFQSLTKEEWEVVDRCKRSFEHLSDQPEYKDLCKSILDTISSVAK